METASPIRIRSVDPDDPHARRCVEAYFREIDSRFDTGFDPTHAQQVDSADLRPPAGIFLVAFRAGEPVGCGGVRLHDDWAEIKRLWVAPEARGLGLGRRILGDLERCAADHGRHVLRLDSNHTLVEAISLYRSSGYREIPRFGGEVHADRWFEKTSPDLPDGT